MTYPKGTIGPSKASSVYSLACRVAPLAEDTLGLRPGSVVKFTGQTYLALGCAFMNLESANLDRPEKLRTLDAEEFVPLGSQRFDVLDEERCELVPGPAMVG